MRESLSGILGEGAANIVLFILLFAAILVAIFIIYAIIKRMSGSSTGAVNYQNERHDPSSRLAVVDAAMVDNQRKLVLVRRDDVEHLILIGGPTDVVVEQNITPDNDYARGSRITEAQIARYQDDYQEDAAPNFAEDFSRAPTRPISTMPVSPLALSDVSKAAPAPQFNAPEPKPERGMAPVREPVVNQTAPVAPAAPVFAPSAPTVAQVQKAPVSTPAPNFTRPATAAPSVAPLAPQPRTVMPAAPAPSAKPATRSHPAYPLSQVSQGVLTSTSAAAAAAAAASIAGASSGRLDHVAAQKSASLDDVKPAQNAPAVAAPTIPAPVVEAKPEPSFDLNFSDKSDDVASLDDALDQALFNDLSTDFFEPEKPDAQKVEDDMAFMLEEELLSSLDMETDIEADLSVDIEDEMEKLLGELSINPER